MTSLTSPKSDPVKEIVKRLKACSHNKDTWHVFCDFVELGALTISNHVDLIQAAEREDKYLELINEYPEDERQLMCEMLAWVVIGLSTEPQDVLGKVFHELELHNKWKGQYFTPLHLCRAIGRVTLEGIDEVIKDKGYITVNEPSCGSGGMLIGLALAMADLGYNYQTQVLVDANDLDAKCTHMCYIQLSLLGIPAVVKQQDTLSQETFATWYTPGYLMTQRRAR